MIEHFFDLFSEHQDIVGEPTQDYFDFEVGSDYLYVSLTFSTFEELARFILNSNLDIVSISIYVSGGIIYVALKIRNKAPTLH